MSKGLGRTQREVLRIVGRSWWDGQEWVLVSQIYKESIFSRPSVCRALRGLVDSGQLTRRGDVVYLSDDFKRMERIQTIERDSGNGLPWWCRKEFQEEVKC